MFNNDYIKIYEYNEVNDRYERLILGEVDISGNGYNMSFVVDGSKDSAKLSFYTYTKRIIKPFSIIHHVNTDTWWVVSKDTSQALYDESYYEEESEVMTSLLYYHNMQLLGAFELLNARDLTDCGFNANRYTIDSFIKRLFAMSTYEFSLDIVYGDNTYYNLDKNQNIDYIKTFENYTLASALRELLDGYNCSAKLSFETYGPINQRDLYISNSKLTIIPKSGDITKPVLSADYFDDVREISTNSKSSYGEVVISNAQNVISTKAKVYPTSGGVLLTGNSYQFDADTAILRLPSPVYQMNWLKIFHGTTLTFSDITQYPATTINIQIRYFDTTSMTTLLNKIEEEMNDQSFLPQSERQYILSRLALMGDSFVEEIRKCCTTTLYAGAVINPTTRNFIAPNNNEKWYAPNIRQDFAYEGDIALVDKEQQSSVDPSWKCIVWERGKDYIENFEMFLRHGVNATRFKTLYDTDLRAESYSFQILNASNPYVVVNVSTSQIGSYVEIKNTYFQVSYIPMSDIKVKVDNYSFGKNIHMYNQNGKLTDSNAFSKLINSYAKEIESDTITRYKTFKNISDLPSIGQLVNFENKQYVIANMSLDFSVEESGQTGKFGYNITGEFTLSRNVATKSALTSPNTNIRDYQIPQNYNVKRKELYRDYYELDYVEDVARSSTHYLNFRKILNVENTYKDYNSHTALIKCTYNEPIGGANNDESLYWYYKLESTVFVLKKQIYEVFDFKDNNIIGYTSQNIYGGFVITEVLNPNVSINTPVSYVDGYGEVKSMEVLLSTYEQLNAACANYLDNLTPPQDTSLSYMLANYPVFIPEDLYNEAHDDYAYDTLLDLTDYNKDATEVPVLEYSCQLGDSENVVIGNEILDNTEDDIFYFYEVKAIAKNKFNNDNIYSVLPSASVNLATVPPDEVGCGYSNSGKVLGIDYNENDTYYVGDIVYHNPSYYKCIVDNTTGAWNSANWELYTGVLFNQTNPFNNEYSLPYESNVSYPVKLSFQSGKLVITPYRRVERHYIDNEVVYSNQADFNEIYNGSVIEGEVDLLVSRIALRQSDRYIEGSSGYGEFTAKVDCMFILKNTENVELTESGEISLAVNGYKV